MSSHYDLHWYTGDESRKMYLGDGYVMEPGYACGKVGSEMLYKRAKDVDHITCAACSKRVFEKLLKERKDIELIQVELPRFSDYKSRYLVRIAGKDYMRVAIKNGWGRTWIVEDARGTEVEHTGIRSIHSKAQATLFAANLVATENRKTIEEIKQEDAATEAAYRTRRATMEVKIGEEKQTNRTLLVHLIELHKDANDPTTRDACELLEKILSGKNPAI
jgi:DNA-directed RNA polymerase subunit RPC12/RpoP